MNANLKNLVKNISSFNKIIDKKSKINKISGHQKNEKIEKKRSRKRNRSRSRKCSRSSSDKEDIK